MAIGLILDTLLAGELGSLLAWGLRILMPGKLFNDDDHILRLVGDESCLYEPIPTKLSGYVS